MASTSSRLNNNNNPHHLSSYFQKTVSLRDWWLIKSDADGDNEIQAKRLAVAGITYGEQQAMRLFRSAPISRRFDIFTLETCDGIIVCFQGFINRQKTIENGFSSEVFNHFLFGFPPYWEEYAENCFKQACSKENDIGNVDNDASKNLPPSSSPINTVTLMEDIRAVQAGLLSNQAAESSETFHDSESNKKGKKTSRISKNKKSAVLESIAMDNSALKKWARAEDAFTDNPNEPNLNQTVRIEASDVVCPVSLKLMKSKKKNQTQEKKDGLKSGITDSSTAASSQGHETLFGCFDGEGEEVTCEHPISPTARDSNLLKQPSHYCKANDITLSTKEKGSIDAPMNNSGFQKCSKTMGNLKDDNHQNPVSECSMKHKNKELTPDVDHQDKGRLKKCSHSILHAEVPTPKAKLKATRSLKYLSENLKDNETNEQLSMKQGRPSMKQARRKISFDMHETPPTRAQQSREKMHILSPESLSLKRSRSGRLLLPTLDFWRNQIPVYDVNRNITGIQEELTPSRGICLFLNCHGTTTFIVNDNKLNSSLVN